MGEFILLGASMVRHFALFLAYLFGSQAFAWVMPLDPQNRFHVGTSLTDSNLVPGIVLGLDSRMTRLVFVDVGGFGSLGQVTEVSPGAAEIPEDVITLLHGITVTPGIRIPHRYGEGFNWDFTFRAGFAALWSDDSSAGDVLQVDPALMGGGDLLLRRETLGLRVGARVFGFRPFINYTRTDATVLRPQTTIELVYQW